MHVNVIRTYTILLCFLTGMWYGTPEQCLPFPSVHFRSNLCRVENDCKTGSDCKSHEKCCDNPCGKLKCYDVSGPFDPLGTCPVDDDSSFNCEKSPTIFCRKENCTSCCRHDTVCNPTPSILAKLKDCKTDICKKLPCKKQGEECFLDEQTAKPFCRCNNNCRITINTYHKLCALDESSNKQKSFLNKCLMDKEACKDDKTFKFLHDGFCKVKKRKVLPYRKPRTSSSIYTMNENMVLRIRCFVDSRGKQMLWLQKRIDAQLVKIPASFTEDEGTIDDDGVTKRILKLILPFGYGNFGEYICRQRYNGTFHETSVFVSLRNEEIFQSEWCTLKKVSGLGNDRFQNYYYNKAVKKCQQFTYKGSGGNQNNFQTKVECDARCSGKPINQSISLAIHHGEQCGWEKCKYYSKCEYNTKTNTKMCVCNRRCSLRPDQVCGSDGKTYLSYCTLKLKACIHGQPLFALYKGKCVVGRSSHPTKRRIEDSPCDKVQCPSYAKCSVNSVTKKPQCYCNTRCSFRPNKVCASNGKTYINECFMKIDSCKNERKWTVHSLGNCKRSQL